MARDHQAPLAQQEKPKQVVESEAANLSKPKDAKFLGERDQDYPFRVYECLVLRIKRPKAICTIE